MEWVTVALISVLVVLALLVVYLAATKQSQPPSQPLYPKSLQPLPQIQPPRPQMPTVYGPANPLVYVPPPMPPPPVMPPPVMPPPVVVAPPPKPAPLSDHSASFVRYGNARGPSRAAAQMSVGYVDEEASDNAPTRTLEERCLSDPRCSGIELYTGMLPQNRDNSRSHSRVHILLSERPEHRVFNAIPADENYVYLRRVKFDPPPQ